MTAIYPWLLALASGVIWGFSFGEHAWTVVPWVALVPLILLLGQRRAWALGWAHGMACWLVSIPWIAPTLERHGQLSTGLAITSLVMLTAYLSLFTALFAAVGSVVWRRRPGGLAVLAVPAIWVGVEWLRGYLFTGFPWNLAAYAWIEQPGALPLAAWVGPWGVAYLLLLSNAAIAASLAWRQWRTAVAALGLSLLALAMAARWAAPEMPATGVADELSVRLLQPDIGILSDWDPVRIESQYREVIELSRSACTAKGELVIWPESAAWPYSYSEHQRLRGDLAALAAAGCPLLVNSSMSGDGGTFNSLLLVTEEGVVGRYDKRHLVPFGEYVPLAGWLPYLQKVARLAGDFLTGGNLGLLQVGRERLAPAICFEITFPDLVAEQVRAGGSMLVTVTNDAWYGDSSAPWQHFRAARFRAAENRRYLLRAALTGISAIVGRTEHCPMAGVGERASWRSVPGLEA